MITASRVAVGCEAPSRFEQAKILAKHLDLRFIDTCSPCARSGAYDYLLCYTSTRLELRPLEPHAIRPFSIDFLSGRLGYRLAHEKNRRQTLARAMGANRTTKLQIIDATAGTGRDALVLATLGCHVRLVERSKIVAALLNDALERAAQSPILKSLIDRRISLESTDAISYLRNLSVNQRPDVVYLDPMYPARTKSAAIKRDMRILRNIVGEDTDASDLLESALACATQRVVVKRPRQGDVLVGPKPRGIVQSKSTRYDIYRPLYTDL